MTPRRHPLLVPFATLAASVGAALAISRLVPLPSAPILELPLWLADALGASDERQLSFAHSAPLWLGPLTVLPFLVVMARRSLVDMRVNFMVTQGSQGPATLVIIMPGAL